MGNVTAFIAGLLFAVGLALAGMTQPAKIIGFLDFFGRWDPSLMAVMAGAIAAHVFFARRALRVERPLFAERFDLTPLRHLDARLIAGSAIFGVGWGISGLCPGPALVALVARTPTTVAFAAAMVAAIAVYRAVLGDPAAA
jgi:uncharacterized protein